MEVRFPSGARVVMTYDALGRRTRKETVSADGRALRLVEFVWDGELLAADIDSEHGIRCFVHDPETGVPLLQQDRGSMFIYVNDHPGTPKDLVDTSGAVVWSAPHSAWSQMADIRRDPGNQPHRKRIIESPFRLPGQYVDGETGLVCARSRYFDPEIGTWCSPEPSSIEWSSSRGTLEKEIGGAVEPWVTEGGALGRRPGAVETFGDKLVFNMRLWPRSVGANMVTGVALVHRFRLPTQILRYTSSTLPDCRKILP